MPRVADYIYHQPTKLLHPYYIQIGGKKAKGLYYRGVFSTLEEAVKFRDGFFQKTSSHEDCEKTAEAL
jgi:hypothetical protein